MRCLQGGPGCAGHFGNYYELGPEWVTPNLKLIPNPGAWNRAAGLLFIDQPVGTGFSPSGAFTRMKIHSKVNCSMAYLSVCRGYQLTLFDLQGLGGYLTMRMR